MKKLMFILLLSLACTALQAQILDRVKNKAKENAAGRAENKADQTVDKALNKVEEGIGSIFKKKDKSKDGSEQGNSNNIPATKNPVSIPHGGTDFSEYKGSSFIPGKNVLFFEDFATTKLGDGTANWHLYEYDTHVDVERPNIRTISASTGSWLKMPRKGFVFPNSFKNLPEQFTVEFDLYADPKKMNEMEGGFRTNFIAKDDRKEYSMHWPSESAIGLDVHPHGANETVNVSAVTEYNSNLSREEMVLFEKTFKSGWNPGEINRVSIYRNGKAVMLYLNGKELVNLPNGLPKKAQYNLIFSTNLWGDGMYVSNIRVAGNVPNAVSEMKADGKFVTNAIYFDVNSSRIKPESWTILNNTAQAIRAMSGNILIIGHTDSDGADDANLKLSQSRAASVKDALVKEFGIDEAKLSTDGKGETQPVTSNNTASGKAQNRRVEFVKQ